MKNMTLISVLLLVSFSCNVHNFQKEENDQKSNDTTIVYHNNSWATLHYGLGSWAIPCNVSTQYVYFEGDSIFAGNSYKKVFSCDDRPQKNLKYEGLIREQNKKTYFIPDNFEKEYLLYDFSLEEGMNFEYIEPQLIPEYEFSVSLYVKKVDFVEINGIPLKQIQFTSPPPYDDIIDVSWIEKIGSLNGLFYPCGMLAPGADRELLCCYQNGELAYKNSTYPECYYDKAEEIIPFRQPDIGVSVYPNPVNTGDLLTISSPKEKILRVELLDISAGELTYKNDNVNTNTYSIDVSVLQNGFYALTVWLYGKGGIFIVYKL